MRILWLLITSVLVLTLSVGSASAQSGYDLYQKALVKERAEGNVEEAIQLYQRVVREFAGNRSLAAKAQLRIGLLYERMGRKAEAQRAFQVVVNQYGDQTEVARQARAKIPAPAANGNTATTGKGKIAAASTNGKAADTLTVRQVWAGPDVDILGAPSPDERYLSYVDWETGDLAIRDLASGKKRRLTNKGSWSESSEYALFSTPSPDGKQIAYDWFNKDQFNDLRIIGSDGSNPRVLYRNEEGEYVKPADWSPDGKHILALFTRKDRTNQIVLVSVADGSVRVLKTLDWRYPGKMSLSTDGRYIAYDFPPKEDAPQRDIFLLTTDGSREVTLVKHAANDLYPVWTPDGKHLLFASDRTGALGLWSIGMAEGKLQKAPELVKPDMGRIVPLGFTRKGSYYYVLRASAADVYITEVDLQTGKLLTAPTPVSERFMGSNFNSVWSLDGKYMVYISERLPVPGLGSRILIIRSVGSGEERELSLPINPFSQPTWSPDGHSILVTGADKKNRQGIYRIDAQTGEVTPLVQSEPDKRIRSAVWSPDGKTIFYTIDRSSSKSGHILARDLETGQEREVYAAPYFILSFALSPDGKQLAFKWSDPPTQSTVLMVIPSAGGVPRELLRVKAPEYIVGNDIAGTSLTWTLDGRQLLFLKKRSNSNESKSELWRISAGGGEPQKTALAMVALRGMSVHPDGRRLAFTGGQYKAEVWVMENFLPAAQSRRTSVSRR